VVCKKNWGQDTQRNDLTRSVRSCLSDNRVKNFSSCESDSKLSRSMWVYKTVWLAKKNNWHVCEILAIDDLGSMNVKI